MPIACQVTELTEPVSPRAIVRDGGSGAIKHSATAVTDPSRVVGAL